MCITSPTTCSYLGKLGYNANITQIEDRFSVSHSSAGMVGTFFFFAYGLGQIFNGIFCKKFNIRFVVFGSLLISGLMNFLVGVLDTFIPIKYIWLINGAALSVLWPALIRLLSETLDKKEIAKAVVVMGTTVATGTFFVYALSALFVAISIYTMMFLVAGILLPLIALLWMVAYPKLVTLKIEQPKESKKVCDEQKKSLKRDALWFPIGFLALFAVVVNLVKDGLTTWVPMILKEIYSLPDFISILLTLILPILAIFGTKVAVSLRSKIEDFVMLSTVLFVITAVFIGLVIICLSTSGWVGITLGSFGIVSCLMSGVNNIITSMAPLFWKDRISSGFLAGVLNGLCYLGSTLSAYGLGAIADFGGWISVFILLLILCVVAAILGVLYYTVKKTRFLKL